MQPPVALSIAGSDSSGGAGIQADLHSFSYLGVHGATVLTSITSQSTQKVEAIFPVPPEVVTSQLAAVLADLPVAAVKTGMLYSSSIVSQVARALAAADLAPVVDPVMVATSGDSLADRSFVSALKQELLPLAVLVTANVPEASVLSGIPIKNLDDAREACPRLFDLGPRFVLIKGGHLEGALATDLLYDGKGIQELWLPRIPAKKAHGSGCTLAALITGLLAQGASVPYATATAKRILWAMINEGYCPGKGADVLSHQASVMVPPPLPTPAHATTWSALRNALQSILTTLPGRFVAEVGTNVVYALPHARTHVEVCGLSGRIVRTSDGPRACGTLAFGGSKHVAAVVLAAMAHDPLIRAAMNIRFNDQTLSVAKDQQLRIASFDRTEEPASSSSTMEWGTARAISALGSVPDLIYDRGGVGKEPMIRLLAADPGTLLHKLSVLASGAAPP